MSNQPTSTTINSNIGINAGVTVSPSVADTIKVPSVAPVQQPNTTNDRSAWVHMVATHFLHSILTGWDDDVPFGPKLPGNLKQLVGTGKNLGPDQLATASPALYNWLVNWAQMVANDWGTYGPIAQSMGWSLGTPPKQDLPSVQDQLTQRGQDISLQAAVIDAQATIKATEIEAASRVQAAEIEARSRVEAAQIAADAERDVAKERANADRDVANIYAQAQRDVANIEGAWNYLTAYMAEIGRNYRFNLELRENARQFNATLMVDLYKTGLELAKNPVDWIAYQYYLHSLSLPTTALNLVGAALCFGAIPPTGPSQYGPCTGGPATYFGDFGAAAACGAMPGLTSCATAVQLNPGVSPFGCASFPPDTLTQFDQMLTGAREQLAQMLNSAMYMSGANVCNAAAQGQDNLLLASMDGTTYSNVYSAGPTIMAMTSPEFQSDQQLMTAVQPALFEIASIASQMSQFSPDPFWSSMQQLYGSFAGITPQTGAPGTNATTPLGTPTPHPQRELAAAVGQLTGQNATAIAASNLLPENWGLGQIMANPFIQNVVQGKTPSLYRTTDPTGWNRFGGIPVLGGQQTGIRSGQDINFNMFAHMLPSQREMLQGLMQATGQYWKDNVEQMLNASPGGFSQIETGSIGRRRI